MHIDFLTLMAYLIVFITIITMVFGIIAYYVYKMRERKRSKKMDIQSKDLLLRCNDERKKYLFFEHKEIII